LLEEGSHYIICVRWRRLVQEMQNIRIGDDGAISDKESGRKLIELLKGVGYICVPSGQIVAENEQPVPYQVICICQGARLALVGSKKQLVAEVGRLPGLFHYQGVNSALIAAPKTVWIQACFPGATISSLKKNMAVVIRMNGDGAPTSQDIEVIE